MKKLIQRILAFVYKPVLIQENDLLQQVLQQFA